MHNLALVTIVDALKQLLHENRAVFFSKFTPLHYLVKQLSTFANPNLLVTQITYSVTIQNLLSSSKNSCILIMLGWSIVLRIVISFKSISFSYCLIFDFLMIFTARYDELSLCIQSLTSPNAPEAQLDVDILTAAENFPQSVVVSNIPRCFDRRYFATDAFIHQIHSSRKRYQTYKSIPFFIFNIII